MQSSMDGIVIIDEDCSISFWNTKAQKIFGWTLKEVIGKNLPELILSEENSCFEISDFFKKIESSGQSNTTLDLLAVDRNNRKFPIELTMISVDDLDYKSKYFVFIRDISSRKEKEVQIQQQNEILKRQNTELEQFNYIASHDLQEPLLTIIGYSDLLLEEFSNDLNEEGKLFLDFIHNSANRMRFLISGLLEYNRINKNSDTQWLDLNNTLSDVIDDLSVNIKESNALVHYDSLPVIECYPIFIRLLFQNLISNALKFRKENTAAEVHIEAKEHKDSWQFSIKDNGIGIEEKYFNQIFQIFRRLHTSEEYSGFGIGLAHCKKIVDIHNGKIWIESKVNEGTTFFFTISKKLKNDN
jgi:PAS domain S-box-containing protein